MASANGSGRPAGSISIPVEIIRNPDSSATNSNSRHNSPYRTLHNDHPYGSFPDSPPWSLSNGFSNSSRFQPRQSPSAAYDRVITNSQFNQPLNDRYSYQQTQDPQLRPNQQRMYERIPTNFSRSNDDLLSNPQDSMRFTAQPQFTTLIPPGFNNNGLRTDSDFVHGNKFSNPLRRSFDALNDFSDAYTNIPRTRLYTTDQQQQQQPQSQPQPQPQQQQPFYRSTYQTQHQPNQPQYQQQYQQPIYTNQAFINPNIVYTDEFGVPADQRHPNAPHESGYFGNERARSPNTQRGPSPARPMPPNPQQTQQQQQQQQPQTQPQAQYPDEPELKMAKDSDGPIPMPAPASFSSQSTDQQVPSEDTPASNTNNSPTTEMASDSNTVALEKLEQMKEILDGLEKEVDDFAGTSRDDRAYKALDEKALKIMIGCDELVDVSADIKDKRKEMIRNVQRVINKLESKVPATPTPNVDHNSNAMETSATIDDSLVTEKVKEQINKTPSPSTSPAKETLNNPTPVTDDSIST